MARSLTSGLQDAITAKNIRPFFLIEGHFDSGNLNLWTGLGNLIFNSKTYIGTGTILQIASIKESKNIEALGTSFTLNGLDQAIIQIAMNEDYQDRPAYLYMGAFDDNWQVIVDPYLAFEGRMDVMPIQKRPDSVTVTLTVENILVDLNKPVIWFYTPEDQGLYFPGDTGFDRVTSLQNKDIQLGS